MASSPQKVDQPGTFSGRRRGYSTSCEKLSTTKALSLRFTKNKLPKELLSCIKGDRYGLNGFDTRPLYNQRDIDVIERDTKIDCKVIIETKSRTERPSPKVETNPYQDRRVVPPAQTAQPSASNSFDELPVGDGKIPVEQ